MWKLVETLIPFLAVNAADRNDDYNGRVTDGTRVREGSILNPATLGCAATGSTHYGSAEHAPARAKKTRRRARRKRLSTSFLDCGTTSARASRWLSCGNPTADWRIRRRGAFNLETRSALDLVPLHAAYLCQWKFVYCTYVCISRVLQFVQARGRTVLSRQLPGHPGVSSVAVAVTWC